MAKRKAASDAPSTASMSSKKAKVVKPKTVKIPPTMTAEKLVSRFSVDTTGAPQGTVIQGRHKGVYGARVVLDTHVRPNKRELDVIRASPLHWEKFKRKLGEVNGFAEMKEGDRVAWLAKHETAANSMKLGTDEGKSEAKMTFSTFGSGPKNLFLIEMVPTPKVNTAYTPTQLNTVFLTRKTLLLHKPFWVVPPPTTVLVSQPKDAVYVVDVLRDLVNPPPTPLKGEPKTEYLIVRPGLYVRVPRHGQTKEQVLRQVELHYAGRIAPSELVTSAKVSLALIKSMLQKVVRFRPRKVKYLLKGRHVRVVSARHALVRVCVELIRHAGALVPNIGKFVSGVSSFFKRAGIILVEDAWTGPEAPFVSLFGVAMACGEGYFPSAPLIIRAIDAMLAALKSKNAAVYDNQQKLTPFALSSPHRLEQASALLDILRSFQGDLVMVRDVFKKHLANKLTLTSVEGKKVPKVMPIWHALDFHVSGNIAYYFDPLEPSFPSPAEKPFAPLFKKLFAEVTGLNPRRVPFHSSRFDKSSFVWSARRAQEMMYVASQSAQEYERKVSGSVTVKVLLSRDWVGAFIGHIEVRIKSKAYLVSVVSATPLQLSVVRKPARGLKAELLSDEVEAAVKKLALEKLKKGVPLHHTAVVPGLLKTARLDDAGSGILLDGKPWKELRHVETTVPLVHPLDPVMELAIVTRSDGLEANAKNKAKQILRRTGLAALHRLLSFLVRSSGALRFPGISRDGGMSDQSVRFEDIEVFHLLLRLSMVMPGALRLDKRDTRRFVMPNRLLALHLEHDILRPLLRKKIQKIPVAASSISWSNRVFPDKEKRKLWAHQAEGLQNLQGRHAQGDRGNFLFISAGMGKTLLVCTFMRWLSLQQVLPRYIIYSYPKEALASVATELQHFFGSVSLLLTQQSISHIKVPPGVSIVRKVESMVPFGVTMVEHDTLRKVADDLQPYLPFSYFVMDEFHKALASSTKRTAAALQMANEVSDFVVLSATPALNSDITQIVPWLQQMVTVDIAKDNFFFALAKVATSYLQDTGLPISDVEVVEKVPQPSAYFSLAPPGLGGNNAFFQGDDVGKLLAMAHELISPTLVRETKKLLDAGRRVMVVAANGKHRDRLVVLLGAALGKATLVYGMTSHTTINLTSDRVEKKLERPYQVVVVPNDLSAGYNLTYLNSYVTSVYASNASSRSQLRSRINRIGQKAKSLMYVTCMVGVHVNLATRYDKDDSFANAMKDIAKGDA